MSQQALGFIEAIVIDVSDLDRSTAFWTAITGANVRPLVRAELPESQVRASARIWFCRKFGK